MIKLEEFKKQLTAIDDINGFFKMCSAEVNSPANNWFFASLELEKSLDSFMQQLAELDRMATIKFST
jgi:hypothetical protein